MIEPMYKAVVTKYHAPTNFKPSRISVRAEGLPVMWFPWDYGKNGAANHLFCATQYAKKYDWLSRYRLVGGSLPDNMSYAFVVVRGEA